MWFFEFAEHAKLLKRIKVDNLGIVLSRPHRNLSEDAIGKIKQSIVDVNGYNNICIEMWRKSRPLFLAGNLFFEKTDQRIPREEAMYQPIDLPFECVFFERLTGILCSFEAFGYDTEKITVFEVIFLMV